MEHYYHPKNARVRGCTIHSNYTTKVTPLNIGLTLLQTCRQIYDEAVLKPFTETRFQYNVFTHEKICGLQKLIDALVPPQAQAIARLRLIVRHHYYAKNNQTPLKLTFGMFPVKGTIMRLKGLKDLEIVLALGTSHEIRARRYLNDISESLPNLPGIIALSDLRLRSLRVTLEADFGGGDDINDTFPTFAARGEREEVEKWLRRFELELHVGSLVDLDREPMPSFAIKQDDDAIPIPPWSTDEAIERALAQRGRYIEAYWLENEEFEDAQRSRVMAGHIPIWTLDEFQKMAETARILAGVRNRNGDLRDW